MTWTRNPLPDRSRPETTAPTKARSFAQSAAGIRRSRRGARRCRLPKTRRACCIRTSAIKSATSRGTYLYYLDFCRCRSAMRRRREDCPGFAHRLRAGSTAGGTEKACGTCALWYVTQRRTAQGPATSHDLLKSPKLPEQTRAARPETRSDHANGAARRVQAVRIRRCKGTGFPVP